MGNHKVCFIMCANDDFLAQECERYICNLRLPAGIWRELRIIRGAASMASGYNEAMENSDARYKVYLHQDVLLVYPELIAEMLTLFAAHPEVGMIGVVGNRSISDGVTPFWGKGAERVGEVYLDLISRCQHRPFAKAVGDREEVLVIDGLLMMTQYDLPWREDLFDGWHFYDASQSLEFRRKGYRVVVPHMDQPWCLHDNDILDLKDYGRYREIFEAEYGEDCRRWMRERRFIC